LIDVDSLQISGKMAPSDRDDQIQAFQHNNKFQIMLSSYGTGGTAIDLTAANKCILMDGWWNMARDEQVSPGMDGIYQLSF
jgi:SNF2 family DNA or RNA helicase